MREATLNITEHITKQEDTVGQRLVECGLCLRKSWLPEEAFQRRANYVAQSTARKKSSVREFSVQAGIFFLSFVVHTFAHPRCSRGFTSM